MRFLSRVLVLLTFTGVLLANKMAAPGVATALSSCADLVITNFTIVPVDTSHIVEGRNAKISIAIKNQGTCDSLSFTVQWRQSNDLFAPPAGPAEHQVGGLAAGASTTIDFEFAYPQAGDYTSVATVDSTNTVDETNESNNVGIAPVKVWANQADLTVTSFSVIPAKPAKGQPATIRIAVYNEGTADAGPFVVQWTQDDSPFTPTGPAKQIPSLAASSTVTAEFTYAFQEARNYNTVVGIDTSNTVAEWNETNNMAIFPVTVVETAPDLVITEFSIKPVKPAKNFPQDQPVAGLNALIEITVKNQGADPAGPFVVQWKSDIFAPTGPSQQINGLAAGASTKVSFQYAFPTAGNFTTVATVDTDNNVTEVNESNNLQVKPVTVQVPMVDLALTKFTVEPAPGVPVSIPPNPVRGRLTRVNITIKNQGNSPAKSFLVKWEPQLFAPSLSAQVNALDYDESITVSFDYTYPQAGTFLTTAKVDDPNQIFETNEGNNNETKLVVVEEQLPDLVITEIKFTPAQPVQGTPAKIRVAIFNQGNTPAGPFQVQFTPAFLAPALVQQVNGLGVDTLQARTAVLNFDFTYGFPGDFTATAVADFTGVVPELNEFNNGLNQAVKVQLATLDLTITKIRFESESCDDDLRSEADIQELLDARAAAVNAAAIVEPQLNQGQPYKLCVTIQNLGNSKVGPFVLSVDPDAFDLFVPSLDTLTQQVDAVAPGQETTISFDVVYPQAGNVRINALVDAFNNVFETNENNNLAVANAVVVATGPDLVISELVIGDDFDLTANPQGERADCLRPSEAGVAANNIPPYLLLVEPRLQEGVPTRVCIEVTNQGNRPSGAFVVEWNADAFGLITTGPTTLSAQMANLEPGKAQIVEFTFTYVQAGAFHTVAKADAFNNVQELNEENNLAIADVVVDSNKADLVIDKLGIESGSIPQDGQQVGCSQPDDLQLEAATVAGEEPIVRAGRPIVVCVLVRNAGQQASGPFVVAWNPDAFGLLVPSPGTLSTQVDNLNAGESALVRFNFEYKQEAKVRTIAKVDFFNTVDESVEGNNEKIMNLVVNPRETTLKIAFDRILVRESFEDGCVGFGCSGEWTVLFAVLDTDGHCKVDIDLGIPIIGEDEFTIDEDGFLCAKFRDDEVETGDLLTPDSSIIVTLVGFEPLLFGSLAFQEAELLDPRPDFAGFTVSLWFALDYLNVGQQTTLALGGECDKPEGQGECYDLTYTVTAVEPDSLLVSSGIDNGSAPFDLPSGFATLPIGFAKLLPVNAELPSGVRMPEEPVTSIWNTISKAMEQMINDSLPHKSYLPLIKAD